MLTLLCLHSLGSDLPWAVCLSLIPAAMAGDGLGGTDGEQVQGLSMSGLNYKGSWHGKLIALLDATV